MPLPRRCERQRSAVSALRLSHDPQNMVKATDERATEVVGRVSYMTSVESGFMWDDTYASQRLDRMAEVRETGDESMYRWRHHLPTPGRRRYGSREDFLV